ncbi:hypothetical protein C2W64_03398 [Brevibacillus laterosporus]|nr:hypothetical protein [Brevibacillus laterosporus]RAP29748.1 hypothetical protein C2W64_03398 [Brevibacillus laterosporus]
MKVVLGKTEPGEQENIMEQIKVAADADSVNKLLQEWLEKMQNKKQPEAKAE